jgi:predicted ArsR family transcriptional regulator
MTPTSRQRVLEFIQSKEVVTSAEISSALHMTAANARHHLSILRDEGVVQVIGQRQKAQRGRPVDLYCLSKPISRHNLDSLAHALLNDILGEKDFAAQTDILERLALRLAPAEVSESKNLTLRLAQAVQHLNRMSYQASWEAHAQGPRVIFHHCPYAAILPQHPEICRLDQLLLKNMLRLPVHLLAKLEMTPSGIPQCVFTPG